MTIFLAFQVLLGLLLLIVVHELGHYAAARWAGVRVLRFSVGFGRALWKRTDRHGTVWALAAIPLGGYVRFLDERNMDEDKDENGDEGQAPMTEADKAQAFNRQPLGKRAVIVAAGPIANFILAIVLLWSLNLHGYSTLRPVLAPAPAGTPVAIAGLQGGDWVLGLNGTPIDNWQSLAEGLLASGPTDARLEIEDAQGHLREVVLPGDALQMATQGTEPLRALGLSPGHPPLPPVIGTVIAEGPAALAGLQAGDRVLEVDDEPTPDWQTLVQRIRQTTQGVLTLTVDRAGQPLTLRVTPQFVSEHGQRLARIGAAPQIDPVIMERMRVVHQDGPVEAMGHAIERTWDLSVFSLRMMGRMLIGEVSVKNLSGPVSIADYAGQSAQAGWISFVGFLALISISLGVLNLLPIPMLDGGHLLYYLLEWIGGRPVPDRVQELAQRVGMALLLTLMTFALYNDLARLIAT